MRDARMRDARMRDARKNGQQMRYWHVGAPLDFSPCDGPLRVFEHDGRGADPADGSERAHERETACRLEQAHRVLPVAKRGAGGPEGELRLRVDVETEELDVSEALEPAAHVVWRRVRVEATKKDAARTGSVRGTGSV